MIVSAILLAALFVVGVALWLLHSPDDGAPSPDGGDTPPDEADCCGMHITCERDSLLTAVSDRVVYYDDEELDAFRGRTADSYTDTETEQFRDVLLTLLPDDIAGWARSIALRGITLPDAVRDELLMIVSEARASRNANATQH